MAYKTVADLNTDTAISIGGKDKNGKANPTELEGYYLGAKTVKSEMSQTGVSKLHVFQTDKGNVGVWGKSKLDSSLASVTPGTMTMVTFTGLGKPSKGRKGAYLYQVQYDPDNTIEVDSTPLTTNASESEDFNNDEDDNFAEEAEYEAPPRASVSAATAQDRAAKVQALLSKNKR